MNNADQPAYPLLGYQRGADSNIHPEPVIYEGLTKREEFAKAAMLGLLASDYSTKIDTVKIAEWSVAQADDLLAALAKKGEGE